MRLIDADELIKAIDYSADLGGALGKVVECVKLYAKFMVSTAPTIEERKTGAWIRTEKHYKDEEQEFNYYEEHCSECGVERKIGWRDVSYCPNCGARMEK